MYIFKVLILLDNDVDEQKNKKTQVDNYGPSKSGNIAFFGNITCSIESKKSASFQIDLYRNYTNDDEPLNVTKIATTKSFATKLPTLNQYYLMANINLYLRKFNFYFIIKHDCGKQTTTTVLNKLSVLDFVKDENGKFKKADYAAFPTYFLNFKLD